MNTHKTIFPIDEFNVAITKEGQKYMTYDARHCGVNTTLCKAYINLIIERYGYRVVASSLFDGLKLAINSSLKKEFTPDGENVAIAELLTSTILPEFMKSKPAEYIELLTAMKCSVDEFAKKLSKIAKVEFIEDIEDLKRIVIEHDEKTYLSFEMSIEELEAGEVQKSFSVDATINATQKHVRWDTESQLKQSLKLAEKLESE